MQRQMEEAQAKLEETEVTGTAGGGVVEVTVTGSKEITKVHIDPEAVDPEDVEMLEDLVMAATNEALHKIDEITGIVFGDLNGDGLIDGRDLLAEKNMITGSVSYDDNPSGYIAGSIGENKTPNGKGLLSLKNYISSEVDFNSNYQVTPEELYA